MSRELASEQRALAAALRDASGATSLGDLAERLAAGNERLTPAMQLEIYRQQFVLRHLDALREDFRSIEHLVGHEVFETLGKAYLQAVPPSSFTLRDLGAELARFVAEAKPWADDPLLADLARVEWSFIEAFDAPDAESLDLAAVASMPEDAWPSARIVLKPSVQRLALDYPAHDYRLGVRRGEAVARPNAVPSWVVIFRGPELLQCLDVDRDAFALLDELARGVALGEACERVALLTGEPEATFEAKVGAWFQQWTALGLISRCG